MMLHTSRQMGFGVGAIPIQEIESYCRLNKFDFDQTERFLWGIKVLDGEYLRLTAEKETAKK